MKVNIFIEILHLIVVRLNVHLLRLRARVSPSSVPRYQIKSNLASNLTIVAAGRRWKKKRRDETESPNVTRDDLRSNWYEKKRRRSFHDSQLLITPCRLVDVSRCWVESFFKLLCHPHMFRILALSRKKTDKWSPKYLYSNPVPYDT